MFLGLVEAGAARILQRLLNLLSDMVVHVDLEEEKTHYELCGVQQHSHQIYYSHGHSLFQLDLASDFACIKSTVYKVQSDKGWMIILIWYEKNHRSLNRWQRNENSKKLNKLGTSNGENNNSEAAFPRWKSLMIEKLL